MTRFTLLPLALLVPTLALVSCKSSQPNGMPNKLPKIHVSSSAAPPRHNMNRGEYPFDEKGNYVAAWAAEGSRGGGNIPAPQPRYSEPERTPTPPPPPPPPQRTSGSTRMIVSNTPSPSRSTPSPTVRTTSTGSSTQYAPRQTVASTSSSSSVSKPTPKPTPKPKPKPKPTSSTVYHTVKSGDTLYGLALRYKSTVAKIKSASGISSDLLRIGQKLKIPR
jgi:LysM repeat protein